MPAGSALPSRGSLQRALEVSLDRWYRYGLMLKEIKWDKPSLKRRSQDVITRFGFGLGILSRDTSYPQETSLLGPALGPFAYSLMLCWGQPSVLIWIFSTWFLGSLIIFLLFRLLGSSHSFFEVMSTIGYAISPLVLLQPLMTLTEDPLPGLSLVIKIAAIGWSSRNASVALVQPNTEKKTFLFACPLILLYIYLLAFRNGA